MEELIQQDVRLRNPLKCNLVPFVVQAIITSNASQDGLGTTLMLENNKFAAQITNKCYSTMTNNAREMLTILLVPRTFKKGVVTVSIIKFQFESWTIRGEIIGAGFLNRYREFKIQLTISYNVEQIELMPEIDAFAIDYNVKTEKKHQLEEETSGNCD
ncbi:MAG: hypothetical protein EZS28_014111 [Streblomastix strix]|uniref:Uncharacterized protein n=1 Tax=Streblomastix strix TaxID=222440 RepID=A0A5J4W5Z7_9EUKA|nr:MAG: hypothetical protein EZS28_014111 [Streblomastix strix]